MNEVFIRYDDMLKVQACEAVVAYLFDGKNAEYLRDNGYVVNRAIVNKKPIYTVREKDGE